MTGTFDEIFKKKKQFTKNMEKKYGKVKKEVEEEKNDIAEEVTKEEKVIILDPPSSYESDKASTIKSKKLESTLDKIHKDALNNKNERVEDTSNSSIFSKSSVVKVIDQISEEKNVIPTKSYKALCVILNQGGTAKRAQNTIHTVIDGVKFDLGLMKRALEKIEGKGATMRKLGRTLADKIAEVCSKEETYTVGNLANKLNRMEPLSPIEMVWASDFQSSNPNCPSRVRKLIERYYDTYVKKK